MSFFTNPINLNIFFSSEESETSSQNQQKTQKVPVYKSGEIVQGCIKIELKNNKSFQHKGIDIQLEGLIESSKGKLQFPFLKDVIKLQPEGTIKKTQSFPFTFRDFPRPIESCHNPFGRAKYVIKAVVHRNFYSDIQAKREIGVQLNHFRPSLLRMYRLLITCNGEPSLAYQQDKREYFADSCIVGKISIEPQAPKFKSLSICVIRKDEFRMLPGFFMNKEQEDVIDFIDLSSELLKAQESEEKSFPVRISLSKYNLQPSARYQEPKLFFGISYLLKIKFEEEEGGRRWSKEVKIPIRRKC